MLTHKIYRNAKGVLEVRVYMYGIEVSVSFYPEFQDNHTAIRGAYADAASVLSAGAEVAKAMLLVDNYRDNVFEEQL